jgi:eukaryotic-like serine/threonine-protein kinase
MELVNQTFPRNPSHYNLGFINSELGNYERALEEAEVGLRLKPTRASSYLSVASCHMWLGHYDKARELVQRAQALNLNVGNFPYNIAFFQGDAAAMQSEMENLRARPDRFFLLSGLTAEANGQLRKDREMTAQAAEFYKKNNPPQLEKAAVETARNAAADALYGRCELVRKDAASAFRIARTPETLQQIALAFALSGDLAQAQSLADEAARLLPNDTLSNTIRLPVIRAALAIHRGNHAKAIELLQSARRYERADKFSAHYFRGVAYLGQRSGVQAGAEFQFILEHRGIAAYSPFYPLAQLGLARAYVVSGDSEKARNAYESFFALWKDADPDLPVLIEAKKEYLRLK